MSAETVYVVVCDSRDDSRIDAVAQRWLRIIDTFAKGAPVILALSKFDLNPTASVNTRPLKKANSSYRGFTQLAAIAPGDPGVERLKRLILDAALSCIKGWDIYRRENILKLRLEMERLRINRVPYVKRRDFEALCERLELTREERKLALEWFHKLGLAYDYSTGLQKYYVLNPIWLMNGIYLLLQCATAEGYLRYGDIEDALRRSNWRYKDDELELLRHIMRQYRISFHWKNAMESREGVEVIPVKLSKDAPADFVNCVAAFSKGLPPDAFHWRWEMNGDYIFPLELAYYIMSEKRDELVAGWLWRYGARFQDDVTQCAATMEIGEKFLDLYVCGRDTFKCMESFLRIIRKYSLPAPPELYICFHKNGKTGQISYAEVEGRCEAGETILCYVPKLGSLGRAVSMKSLLLGKICEDEEYITKSDASMERTASSQNYFHGDAERVMVIHGNGNTVSIYQEGADNEKLRR